MVAVKKANSHKTDATLDQTKAILLSESPDIAPFEDEWERLFAYPGNEPSTSFEWTRAMLQNHLSAGDRVFLLGLTRASETLALAPLVARSMRVLRYPVRVLCPISDNYNTHSDLLSSSLDEQAARAFMAALYELPVQWDVFRMSNLLEEHALVRHFVSAAPRRTPPGLLRESHASYFLNLPPSYEDYLAARTAKFRSHLKRTERKIQAEHSVAIREFTGAAEIDRAYEMLLEIERHSWKHAHGTAITAVQRQVGFYRELCRGAAARGRLHLQVLLLDDQPAAYNLGYIRDEVYSYLKTSFVEAWKPLGVASFLRALLVRSLIERRLRCMDFPAVPYEWERQWTETVRWHKTLTLYRPTPAGVALSLLDRLRKSRAAQRTIQHVDPRDAGLR